MSHLSTGFCFFSVSQIVAEELVALPAELVYSALRSGQWRHCVNLAINNHPRICELRVLQ